MRTVWEPRTLRLLRLCAEKGISQRETSIYLGVSPAAVAIRASAEGISFHGKPGRQYVGEATHRDPDRGRREGAGE